jgi:hypothetical protein
MVSVAVLVPLPVGLKNTETVQVALGSMLCPQSLAPEKSEASVPTTVMLGIVQADEPSLVMTMIVGGLTVSVGCVGKKTAAGEKLILRADSTDEASSHQVPEPRGAREFPQ